MTRRTGSREASNALLLSPAGTGYPASLSAEPIETAIVAAVTPAAATRAGAWLRDRRTPPSKAVVVLLGDGSGTPPSLDDARPTAADVTVETVADPADVAALGIALDRHLREVGRGSSQSLLLLDSLTPLVVSAGLERTFRFTDLVTRRAAAFDVTTAVRADPAAHDRQTLATLATLFDAVHRYVDGAWETDVTPPAFGA